MRQRQAYRAEDNRLAPENQQTMIDAFLTEQNSRLDPPQYAFARLRGFLEEVKEEEVQADLTLPQYSQPLVLIDDRQSTTDTTGWLDLTGIHRSPGDWTGSSSYLPEGERRESHVLNAGELYRKLSRSVGISPLQAFVHGAEHDKRLTDGAERRTMLVSLRWLRRVFWKSCD